MLYEACAAAFFHVMGSQSWGLKVFKVQVFFSGFGVRFEDKAFISGE